LVVKLTADLIARKAVTHELGAEPLPAPIAAFIDRELEIARPALLVSATILSDEARVEAERFYRKTMGRCA
jgi:uncharacterized protein